MATVINVAVGALTLCVLRGQQSIMQRQLQLQRPIIGISDVKIEKAHVFGLDGWLITAIIKNSGTTQTHGLRLLSIQACLSNITIGGTEMNCSLMERPETGPLDPEDSFLTPLAKIRTIPILPQATIQAGSAFLPTATIKPMADKGALGYLYGVIHYFDGFDGTPEHVTKYCFEFNGTVAVTDTEQKPVYSYCPHWNCADEECDADRKDYESEFAALPNGKALLEIQRNWRMGAVKRPY